jgi:hypothetical protein
MPSPQWSVCWPRGVLIRKKRTVLDPSIPAQWLVPAEAMRTFASASKERRSSPVFNQQYLVPVTGREPAIRWWNKKSSSDVRAVAAISPQRGPRKALDRPTQSITVSLLLADSATGCNLPLSWMVANRALAHIVLHFGKRLPSLPRASRLLKLNSRVWGIAGSNRLGCSRPFFLREAL